MLVKSHGESKWLSRGKQQRRLGTQYIHFNEGCLRAYDLDQNKDANYEDGEEFDFARLEVDSETLLLLTEEEKAELRGFGVNIN